jgi:hypothetical protein
MAACGQQTAPTASAIDPTEPVSPTVQTTSAEPASPSPTRTISTETTAPVAGRPAGLRGMLLAPEELSGTWTSTRTAREGDTGAGSCQVTPMVTIGALSALRRSYVSGEDSAVQIVAKFADNKSAWRSFEVLKSWREKCISRLVTGSSVSSLANVTVSPAVGHRYLVTQPVDAASKQYERVGLVRRGSYLSLIAFFHAGKATSYPVGHEP